MRIATGFVILILLAGLTGCGGGGGGGGTNPPPTGNLTLEAYVYAPTDGTTNLMISRTSQALAGYVPLAGAQVEVQPGTRTITQTDASGHFSVSGLSNTIATVTVKPPAGTDFLESVSGMLPSSGYTTDAVDVVINRVQANLYPKIAVQASFFDNKAGSYITAIDKSNFEITIDGRPTILYGWGQDSPNPSGQFTFYVRDTGPTVGANLRVELKAHFGVKSGSAFALIHPVFRNPYEDPEFYNAGFGGSAGTFYWNHIHLGEDSSQPEGTPIVAIGDGRIVQYEAHSGYGELCCVIEHDFGHPVHFSFKTGDTKSVSAQYVCSIYGHIRNSQVRGGPILPWKFDDVVHAGDIIGYINDDANNGDGPEHLHMGVRFGPHVDHQWRYYGYENISTPDSLVSNFCSFSELMQKLQ